MTESIDPHRHAIDALSADDPSGTDLALPFMDADRVRALFDRIAPVYDRLNDDLSFGLHRIWKRMTASWSRAKPGDLALDLCCGSGDLTLLLAQKVRDSCGQGRAIGVDFSGELLDLARQRWRDRQASLPVEWVEADALDLPFESDRFNAATLGYGLRNIADRNRALQEMKRVLVPGGTVAILDMHRPEDPRLEAFQRWYLKTLVVPKARDCGLGDDYAYILPSLEAFPRGAEQVQLALAAGFERAVHYPIAAGMMGVLVATK